MLMKRKMTAIFIKLTVILPTKSAFLRKNKKAIFIGYA
jgi:hypothetical protein